MTASVDGKASLAALELASRSVPMSQSDSPAAHRCSEASSTFKWC